jgi:hypothetical protein
MRAGLDSHQQRLRLSDLGHFRRRRKAFECRSEDGLGLGGAVGRLIELGKGERGAQLKAARALLACDGDGALEGFFGGESVGRVAPEKDLAADAMGFDIVPMQPGSL